MEKGYNIGLDLDSDKISVCICSGLKQYVCIKDSKRANSYHSITEKEIRIHPGSYLYGENPDWIIGGEIVNTGRTYARTGIAVSENIIRENFSDLYSLITGKGKIRKVLKEATTVREKEKPPEENRILILDKYFDIVKEKNEKIIYVPYHIIIQLKAKKEKILHYDFGTMKAKLFFKEKLIVKDKMKSLVQYFDKIDLDNGINQKFPKNDMLVYPDDWIEIYRYMDHILAPTLSSQKANKTGFLTLRFLEETVYEYYLENDFFCAIEESLKAMEKIFDSEVTAWNDKERLLMESIHHKLHNLSEEMDV
ncbi:MAG: hypothetical protein A2Y34_05240 [Spirochaetes bacterium GWC1_27_15]|nr:MAG: hypothetical protein A2Y34_05240 [Spirochaetes bacterium GWC1_27_15]